MKEKTIICNNCEKPGAQVHHVSRSYGEGEALFVLEKLPLISCPHCEESYFTEETLQEIERIKRQLLSQEYCLRK
jgi:YgiT-type zinc finger domain-containing protein